MSKEKRLPANDVPFLMPPIHLYTHIPMMIKSQRKDF